LTTHRISPGDGVPRQAIPVFLQSVLRCFHTSHLRIGPSKNLKSVSQGQAAMAIKALFDRMRRLMRDLRTANGANVTITFALATVPIVGFVGAAVDYSHANSVKTALQAATDATALMLSKTASTMTNAQLQTAAFNYLQALFTRTEATGLSVTATYSTSNGQQVFVVSSADVQSNFMTMMGISTMKVGADSQVRWGNVRMRVALVLDTTGSMADDGKMNALKPATKSLLDQLKTSAVNNGDVLVSIIPFSKDVNVGKSNYNATWIDWNDWEDDNGDDVSSTKCTSSKGKKKKCTTSTTWVPDNHNTWNGCVTDRGNSNSPHSSNYDTNVTAPSINNVATLFAAEQFDDCSPKIMPLGYDWQGMKDLVDTFYPAGNTNQAIGLAHGWMSLVGGGPYPAPPAKDPNYQYQDIIILLTDGLNTEDRWYTNQNQIDARQKMTCDNINAAGVTLYAIQVNTGGDPTSTLLQNCAGTKGKYPDSSKFFLLTSSTQIVDTFKQIGTKLSNLRIAQ
jgi:Flp pilus assembly protein TadG